MTSLPPIEPEKAIEVLSEASDWLLPTASELYKRREAIQSLIQKLTSNFGKKTIVFLGMKGVGKTVLLDYITGRAFNRQYTLPKTSTQIEEGKAGKLVLKILPGVEARITFETEFLEESSNIDGIVYVAAYGFASTRQEDARKALAGQGIDTLEKYRELQLRGEIEFLEEACGFLRSYIKRYKKPAWMLVAVTKCDLYYSFAREAEQYYSPYGDSRFVKVLREFQARIGSDNFAWSPRPVCSRLEDFSWNGQLQSSVLKEEQRNHFLAAFLEKLNEYAEGRCFYE